MNKNIYIYSIIFIILLYIFINRYNKCNTGNKYNKGNKEGNKNNKNVIGGEELENKKKSEKIVNNLSRLLKTEQYKNVEQGFMDVTHISEFIDNKFNYNSFQLHFSINRAMSMITDLEGGILTFGSTTTNFHNFFIYLRKKELIVGLLGYNTHVSINLDKIKTASNIQIKLLYNNPYLNVHITTDTISGYIDYLGNINKKINKNFRLYLHPFYNSWCSIGTSSFIVNEINFSAAKALLPEVGTSINNILLLHNKREMKEIVNESIDFNTKNYNNLNISSGNIIIMNLELTYSDANSSLVKLFTNKKDSIELIKTNKSEIKLILNYDNNSKKKTIVNIENIVDVNIIYIEIIPYIKKNMFCIYIDNNFYKYIIDFDLLIDKKNPEQEKANKDESLFGDEYEYEDEDEDEEKNEPKKVNVIKITDITINSDSEKLVESFELYEEEFIYNREKNIIKLTKKIDETQKKKNSKYDIYFDFKKNVKMEYFKLFKSENMSYKLSVLDIYNNWNLITKIRITKKNTNHFSNKQLLINNNLYGSKYRLQAYTNNFYLQPLKYLKKSGSNYIIDSEYIFDSTLSDDNLWKFDFISTNKYRIKKQKKKNLSEPYKDYILEKKENTDNIYYIYVKDGKVKRYVYFDSDSDTYLTKLTKENCEILRTPHSTIDLLKDDDIIELFGIENPYPKLYVKNNDLNKSHHPCSDIYSKNKTVMIDIQSSYVKDIEENKLIKDIDKDDWGPVSNNKIIEGNIYNFRPEDKFSNSHMFYNFCSNDMKNFRNKLYRYNFEQSPYYNIDEKDILKTDNYKKKKRIAVRELTEAEQNIADLINKLRDGVNFIGYNNSKKLTNSMKWTDLHNVWNANIIPFFIDWDDSFGFTSGCSISIESPTESTASFPNRQSGVDRLYLDDIRIYENIFDDEEIQQIIGLGDNSLDNSIKNNMFTSLAGRLLGLKKTYTIVNAKFLKFDKNYNSDEKQDFPDKIVELVIKKPPKDPCDKTDAEKAKEAKEKKDTFEVLKYLTVNLVKKMAGTHYKKWKFAKDFLSKYKVDEKIAKNTDLTMVFNTLGMTTTPEKKTNVGQIQAIRNCMAMSGKISSFGGSTSDGSTSDGSMFGGMSNVVQVHTKDQNHYFNKLLNTILAKKNIELRQILRRPLAPDEDGGKELHQIYIEKVIPKIKTTTYNINSNEKNIWQLEWDGDYEPQQTEFHLKHKNGRYLIAEQDTLKWSDTKVIGYGWKIISSGLGEQVDTTVKDDATKLAEDEKQKKEVELLIINKITQVTDQQISEKLAIFNDETKALEVEYERRYYEYLEYLRQQELRKVVKKGCHLFSPNIGRHGMYFQHNNQAPPKEGKKEIDNVGAHLSMWKPQEYGSDIFIKVWDSMNPNIGKKIKIKIRKGEELIEKIVDAHIKNKSEIVISKKFKNKTYYLQNVTNKERRYLWVDGPPNTNAIWKIEFEKTLHLNLDSMDPPPFDSNPDYIKKNFIGVENKRVTIQVGQEVGKCVISRVEPWKNDVYEAIRFAASKGFVGCRDYSWITYVNGKLVFYDDNYCNYLKPNERNTITRGWFILHKDQEISNMYLRYNKIKYQYAHGIRYYYRRCMAYKRRIWGGDIINTIDTEQIGGLPQIKGVTDNPAVKGITSNPAVKGALNTIANNPALMGPLASVSGIVGDALGAANDLMSGIASGDPIGAVTALFKPKCIAYFYYLWSGKKKHNSVGRGIKIGMDKWLKQATGMNQGKPPSSWTDRVNNMYSELNYYKGCNSSINDPVTIYLKSGANNQYLRSDSTTVKFTDKKEAFISGWHILMKNGNFPWNKIYKTKASSGKSTPYTLIGPGYCHTYYSSIGDISSKYYKSKDPIKKCAEGVKKYLQTTEYSSPNHQYFQFLEHYKSGDTYCRYVQLDHPCLDKEGNSKLSESSNSGWKFYKFH